MYVDRRFVNLRFTIDGIVAAPTGSEATGAQYLVAAEPTSGGAFEGKAGQIAYKTADGWKFIANFVGESEVIDLTTGLVYHFNGTSWVEYDIASANVKTIVDPRIQVSVDDVLAAVVADAASLPDASTLDDGAKVLVTGENKIYTVDSGAFNSGVAIANGARYAFADSAAHGYIYEGTDGEAVATELTDGVIFINKANEDLYTYDESTHTLINVTDIGSRPEYRRHSIVVTHALTAAEITALSFALPKLAVIDLGVSASVNGVAQVSGVDFEVTNSNGASTFSWDALGMAALDLQEGDYVVVSYHTEQF